MKSHWRSVTRRDLFKLGLALSPLAFLNRHFDSVLVDGYKRFKGEAKELKTYVMLNLYGAPVRWIFDNTLRPNGDDEIINHSTVYTNYVDEGKDHYDPLCTPVEYSTVLCGDWHMPRLWSAQIYFRGELVPMTKLQEHMFTIRGVKHGHFNHPSGNMKQICVRNGELSNSGLVADSSMRPIPALSLGASPAAAAFTSACGSVQLELPYENSSPNNNLIHFLTRSFVGSEDNALGLPKNFDATAEYEGLLKKYGKILAETKARCPIAGLTDKSLRVSEFADVSEEALLAKLQRFKMKGCYVLDHDYSVAIGNAQIGMSQFIEKQMALAEFVLLRKISSSLVLAPPKGLESSLSQIKSTGVIAASDLKFKTQDDGRVAVDFKASQPQTANDLRVPFDSHGYGSFYTILGCSLFFQGYSACLAELIQTLKDHSTAENNIFADTVIHLASEFDRIFPVADGDSDHYGEANPTSLFSGMMDGHTIVGNVLAKSTSPYNTSTVGEAGPLEELGGKVLFSENILSSISKILGGRELTFRYPSILAVRDGKLTSSLAKPRNIKS